MKTQYGRIRREKEEKRELREWGRERRRKEEVKTQVKATWKHNATGVKSVHRSHAGRRVKGRDYPPISWHTW